MRANCRFDAQPALAAWQYWSDYWTRPSAAGSGTGDNSGNGRREDENDQGLLALAPLTGGCGRRIRILILTASGSGRWIRTVIRKTYFRGVPRLQRRSLAAVGQRQGTLAARYEYGLTVAADVEPS